MAKEPNKNHGALKLRFPLKKHQMTKFKFNISLPQSSQF